jgi:putative FmdB family regulatory protein
MPIFEYRCKKCGRVSEVFQKSSREENIPPCSGCGHKESERQFSCFSSGWKGAASGSTGCRPSSGFR